MHVFIKIWRCKLIYFDHPIYNAWWFWARIKLFLISCASHHFDCRFTISDDFRKFLCGYDIVHTWMSTPKLICTSKLSTTYTYLILIYWFDRYLKSWNFVHGPMNTINDIQLFVDTTKLNTMITIKYWSWTYYTWVHIISCTTSWYCKVCVHERSLEGLR